jgi:serine/threonine protein kinase
VVTTKVVTFASNEWRNVSKEAKKLLMGMLEKKVDKRLSAVEALSHSWFQKTHSSTSKITYQLSDLHML